jgi:hypothetical protein
MNFWAIILSVYFLGLNFVPCEDAVQLSDSNSQFQQLKQEVDHSPINFDDCSPFCQCHCCHVHVTIFNGTSYEAIEPVISTLIIQKGEISGLEIPNFHFQPPRI